MSTICPQRILQEAQNLLSILECFPISPDLAERLDNNLQELQNLSHDGLTQIEEHNVPCPCPPNS